MTYLWLKAGHIIFMVFWLAGLFMLPRQMIYLHPASPGSDESALWAKRMGLLRKVILAPSLRPATDGVSWDHGCPIEENDRRRSSDERETAPDVG